MDSYEDDFDDEELFTEDLEWDVQGWVVKIALWGSICFLAYVGMTRWVDLPNNQPLWRIVAPEPVTKVVKKAYTRDYHLIGAIESGCPSNKALLDCTVPGDSCELTCYSSPSCSGAPQ